MCADWRYSRCLRFAFVLNIVDPEQQERRAIKRQAMAEYYEKHGGGDHH